MKNNIKQLAIIYFILFGCLIVSIFNFLLPDNRRVVLSAFNPRVRIGDETIQRGAIKDINGVVIAHSVRGADGTFRREYPLGREFAHVVGYSSRSKAGLEAVYGFELERISNEVFARIRTLFADDDDYLQANNVVLTIDSRIQNIAHQQLQNRRGSIIVMDPSTGKIIAMASSPGFNPNTVQADWNNLQANPQSPLINRATQGRYAPGSVFKLAVALSALENIRDIENFTYNCTGEAFFGDSRIRCFNSMAHGEINLAQAIAVSCNTIFAELLTMLGPEALERTVSNLHLNASISFPLESNAGSFVLGRNSDVSELVETSIGQGRTLVTPMNIAMAYSAVANGGRMMRPYIVSHFERPNGRIYGKTYPRVLDNVMPTAHAQVLNDMLVGVVTHGTATSAAVRGVTVAGKTGTAENDDGASHAWFVAYASRDGQRPDLLVCVMLENHGMGSTAIPIARRIIEAFYS